MPETRVDYRNIPAYALRGSGVNLPRRFTSELFDYRRTGTCAVIELQSAAPGKAYAEVLDIGVARKFEERQLSFMQARDAQRQHVLARRELERALTLAGSTGFKARVSQEIWERIDAHPEILGDVRKPIPAAL